MYGFHQKSNFPNCKLIVMLQFACVHHVKLHVLQLSCDRATMAKYASEHEIGSELLLQAKYVWLGGRTPSRLVSCAKGKLKYLPVLPAKEKT